MGSRTRSFKEVYLALCGEKHIAASHAAIRHCRENYLRILEAEKVDFNHWELIANAMRGCFVADCISVEFRLSLPSWPDSAPETHNVALHHHSSSSSSSAAATSARRKEVLSPADSSSHIQGCDISQRPKHPTNSSTTTTNTNTSNINVFDIPWEKLPIDTERRRPTVLARVAIGLVQVVQSSPHLRTLELSGVPFGDDSILRICKTLTDASRGPFDQVENVILSNVQLHDQSVPTLLGYLGHLPSLTAVSLAGNYLTDACGTELINSFIKPRNPLSVRRGHHHADPNSSALPSLSINLLDLSYNEFTDNFLVQLADAFEAGHGQNLQQLNLNGNHFRIVGHLLDILTSPVACPPNLMKLQFCGIAAELLPESIPGDTKWKATFDADTLRLVFTAPELIRRNRDDKKSQRQAHSEQVKRLTQGTTASSRSKFSKMQSEGATSEDASLGSTLKTIHGSFHSQQSARKKKPAIHSTNNKKSVIVMVDDDDEAENEREEYEDDFNENEENESSMMSESKRQEAELLKKAQDRIKKYQELLQKGRDKEEEQRRSSIATRYLPPKEKRRRPTSSQHQSGIVQKSAEAADKRRRSSSSLGQKEQQQQQQQKVKPKLAKTPATFKAFGMSSSTTSARQNTKANNNKNTKKPSPKKIKKENADDDDTDSTISSVSSFEASTTTGSPSPSQKRRHHHQEKKEDEEKDDDTKPISVERLLNDEDDKSSASSLSSSSSDDDDLDQQSPEAKATAALLEQSEKDSKKDRIDVENKKTSSIIPASASTSNSKPQPKKFVAATVSQKQKPQPKKQQQQQKEQKAPVPKTATRKPAVPKQKVAPTTSTSTSNNKKKTETKKQQEQKENKKQDDTGHSLSLNSSSSSSISSIASSSENQEAAVSPSPSSSPPQLSPSPTRTKTKKIVMKKRSVKRKRNVNQEQEQKQQNNSPSAVSSSSGGIPFHPSADAQRDKVLLLNQIDVLFEEIQTNHDIEMAEHRQKLLDLHEQLQQQQIGMREQEKRFRRFAEELLDCEDEKSRARTTRSNNKIIPVIINTKNNDDDDDDDDNDVENNDQEIDSTKQMFANGIKSLMMEIIGKGHFEHVTEVGDGDGSVNKSKAQQQQQRQKTKPTPQELHRMQQTHRLPQKQQQQQPRRSSSTQKTINDVSSRLTELGW